MEFKLSIYAIKISIIAYIWRLHVERFLYYMIELAYFLPDENDKVVVYQVIQFSPDDPWRVVLDGELLGSFDKFEGQWRQLSGEDFSNQLFLGIVNFVDMQNFNDLPAALMARWNKQIQEVVSRSDQEYLIVCKPELDSKVLKEYSPGLYPDY